MDRSLQEYLEQRSTEELDVILNYMVNNYAYHPEETVSTITAILEEREKDTWENSQEFRDLRERFLEKARQQNVKNQADDS